MIVNLIVALVAIQGRVAPLPPIDVDSSEAPELFRYTIRCQALMGVWYPKILRSLGQSPDPLQRRITLRIRADHPEDMKGWVAYASGDSVTVFADYARGAGDDIGAIIHELTHVLQKYKNAPGWIVEGIADYVRYFVYEPKPRPEREDLKGRSYKDGYGTTAAFLAWTQAKYDRSLVPRLHADARAGLFNDRTFRKYTGKDVDTLWSEYVQARLDGR